MCVSEPKKIRQLTLQRLNSTISSQLYVSYPISRDSFIHLRYSKSYVIYSHIVIKRSSSIISRSEWNVMQPLKLSRFKDIRYLVSSFSHELFSSNTPYCWNCYNPLNLWGFVHCFCIGVVPLWLQMPCVYGICCHFFQVFKALCKNIQGWPFFSIPGFYFCLLIKTLNIYSQITFG